MNEDKYHQDLLPNGDKLLMRNRLFLYFDNWGRIDDAMVDFLLELITSFLDFLYSIRGTSTFYQENIKELLFRQILRRLSTNKGIKRKSRHKIIGLRDRIFTFLIVHQYLDEKPDTHKEHIRTIYDMGQRYMSFRFNLLPDMEKIKEYTSPELYDFLLKEGISSYLEFLELQHLQNFSFEELEKRIEGASSQKIIFNNQILQTVPRLTSAEIPQELTNKIEGKRSLAINYCYAFEQSEKLFRIALKIKLNRKFASELTVDNINKKTNRIYLI